MIRRGDTVTIADVYVLVPNPDRRWWQFWKPKMVEDRSRLQIFKVL